MKNFIEEFHRLTRYIESPTSYLEWAAYTTLAAVMRDNMYVQLGAFRKIYPSLYVLLVGDSAETRKSTPLKVAISLIRKVNNTKVIAGRASIQGVLNELAAVKNINGRTISGASCFLYSEEFAAFLVKDPQTSGIITDIYDYKDEHDIILRSQETVHLKNVCVTLLSATNNDFLHDIFTKVDIFGGFVGRTMFIMEEKARFKEFGFNDNTTEEDFNEMTDHLIKLSQLKGRIHVTKNAQKYIEDWYNNTDFSKNDSKTGFEHRAHVHALKLAIIHAASEPDFNMVLEQEHVVKGIDSITKLWNNYKKIATSINPSTNSIEKAITEIMVCLIKYNKPVRRTLLLQGLLGRVDLETFDKAVQTLEASDLLDICGSANQICYEISKKGREMFLSEVKTNGKLN